MHCDREVHNQCEAGCHGHRGPWRLHGNCDGDGGNHGHHEQKLMQYWAVARWVSVSGTLGGDI